MLYEVITPDAAVVCRNDGSIIWCNKLAGHLLGFRWPEDAGQNISNLIRNPSFVSYRITSYNVCYTKLLRPGG